MKRLITIVISLFFCHKFMRNINSSRLTKDTILSKISQINIFSTYFNVPIEVIQHCIDGGELITSPIRIDDFPTFGFRYDNRGKLKAKDFAGYFWGDCFDAVAFVISEMYKKEFNVSNKQDFIHILRHISLTFKDIFYGSKQDGILHGDIHKAILSLKHKKPNIELVIRSWNEYDKQYWKDIGVDLGLLNTHFIYPVEQYYINRKSNPEPKYYYNTKDPCYAYNLGKDKFGIFSIKLYFPKRDKTETRFITNCNHLEGIYNLDRSDYNIIVVTKSTKDRMAIISHIIKMKTIYVDIVDTNIGVINIPHETYKLRQNEYDWLSSKLTDDGIIISLMDNDEVGINQSNWLYNAFSIKPFLVPKRYNSKDFAEFRYNTSFKEVSKNIIKTIKYIENEKDSKRIRWTDTSNDVPF